MEEDKRRVADIDELRAAIAALGDAELLRRFDAAVQSDRRIEAVRIAREAGVTG